MSQHQQPAPASAAVRRGDDPPREIRGDNLTARVLQQKVWRPPNKQDDWSVFVIVGREGSGKSHTTLSILEKCDPSFDAGRVNFEPQSFLTSIHEIPEDERRGKAVMLDEAGVGMGVRTWYDREQIQLNKVMQTARDDNMIVGMTLPRLSELDSQLRGRLHAFLEMTELERGEYAKFKWKNISPTRDERDEIYKWYPRMRVNGTKRKVTRLAIGPPSDDLIAAYEERKSAFKDELYEEASEQAAEDDDLSTKEIGDRILADGPEQYVSENPAGDYLDKDLIALDYDIGMERAKQVKKHVLRESDLDVR